ncbi:uridine kinase [Lacticaseibacillus sp. N501-2]|uniref:uridine kinase n=1 Tax=Lacticaseibacillus salsurae TaxID=3367729 RepID=UPI0038B3BAFA
MAKPIVIGIAGGSASGKTSVAQALCEAFDQGVVLLQQDSYYKHSDLPFKQRQAINYDHPDAFDHDLLVTQLQALISRQAIDVPVYDYADHNRALITRHVEPQDVIIIEGILVLADPALRALMDLRVFVDTDADVRVLRRIQRDTKTRGRSLDSVITQYLTTVRPAYLEFIEPTKRFADVIIPEGGKNRVAIDLLRTKIAATLAARGEKS